MDTIKKWEPSPLSHHSHMLVVMVTAVSIIKCNWGINAESPNKESKGGTQHWAMSLSRPEGEGGGGGEDNYS